MDKKQTKDTAAEIMSEVSVTHREACTLVRAVMEYEGRKDLTDGAITLPAIRPFVRAYLFEQTMERLAEELRNLRGPLDAGRVPNDETGELEPETLAGAVLESLASYFSCVAEDGTWSAPTFQGLGANLSADLIHGIDDEELQLIKDHPALHWSTRQHAQREAEIAAEIKPTPIRTLMAKQGVKVANGAQLRQAIQTFANGTGVQHDRAAIDEHLHNPKADALAGAFEQQTGSKIAWVSPPCQHVAKESEWVVAFDVENPDGSVAGCTDIVSARDEHAARDKVGVTYKGKTIRIRSIERTDAQQHAVTTEERWAKFCAELPTYGLWKASWEFPGYICWTRPGLDVIVFATPDWETKHEEISIDVQSRDGNPISSDPDSCRSIIWPEGHRSVASYMKYVGQVLGRVEGRYLLKPRDGQYQGRDMYDAVMAELQNAEEMGGPEDENYVALMEEIARMAAHRASVCRENLTAKITAKKEQA